MAFSSKLSNPMPTSCPLFLHDLTTIPDSWIFLPGRNPQIRAVAPNGLLLCETRHPSRYNKCFYTITKLSTKQWKGLPIPKTRFFTQNIAIYILSSNPLHFKILRLSQDRIPSKRPLPFCYTICEVFDSVSWRWKQLDDIVQDYNSEDLLNLIVLLCLLMDQLIGNSVTRLPYSPLVSTPRLGLKMHFRKL
ncbi:unnamed protein product [Citrullus colocynthis]|uniref:Uncharacterized protein n=1 Tax=Citrullus colocynthis TaxID=252529 RepID=A0ABP0YTV3_9ROSI